MNRKKKLLIGCLAFVLLLVYMLSHDPSRHITLKLGMFVGSNFDVHNGDSYAIIDETIELFEKEHPNVSIEYESGIVKSDYSSWLSKKILKGEQLDVFMVLNEDFNTLASINALQNLNEYVKDNSIFYDGILDSGRYNGNLYALAYEASPMMMCVNKDLLIKEGISIPNDKWTMKEFYDICQRVTKDTNNDGSVDQFGNCNYEWQDAINGYGIELFDDYGKACRLSSAKDALSFVQKLKALNGGYHVTSNDFDEGKVAFCPLTIAQYRTYQPYPYRVSKYSTFSWYCLPMPGNDNNKETATCQTSLMAVNARSDHKDLAYDFIEILTSQKVQQDLIEKSQGVSVLKDVMNNQETKQILQDNDENDLNIDILNNILENIIVEPKFKNYYRILEKADYLISRSIDKNQIELDVFTIQEQLINELKQ